MGTHVPTEWMVLCGGVDLRAFTEGLGANFDASSFLLQSSSCLRVDSSDTLHNSCVTVPFPGRVLANLEQSCHKRVFLCFL